MWCSMFQGGTLEHMERVEQMFARSVHSSYNFGFVFVDVNSKSLDKPNRLGLASKILT